MCIRDSSSLYMFTALHLGLYLWRHYATYSPRCLTILSVATPELLERSKELISTCPLFQNLPTSFGHILSNRSNLWSTSNNVACIFGVHKCYVYDNGVPLERAMNVLYLIFAKGCMYVHRPSGMTSPPEFYQAVWHQLDVINVGISSAQSRVEVGSAVTRATWHLSKSSRFSRSFKRCKMVWLNALSI